jgi:hypothetical protein
MFETQDEFATVEAVGKNLATLRDSDPATWGEQLANLQLPEVEFIGEAVNARDGWLKRELASTEEGRAVLDFLADKLRRLRGGDSDSRGTRAPQLGGRSTAQPPQGRRRQDQGRDDGGLGGR